MCRDLRWLPAQNYAIPEEQDEYDDKQSMAFLVLDTSDNVIGTARLVLHGEVPLPIERHFELYPRELLEAIHGKMECCVEVSRFIIPQNPTFRSHEITQVLCIAMIKIGITKGITHMFVSADHRFFRLLKMLGFPLAEIGKEKFHMGSKTIPGILTLKDMPSIFKQERPFLYELLTAREKLSEDMISI